MTSSPVAYRYYDGILIQPVSVPNSFGGPDVESPGQSIRGLITPFRSEESQVGGFESSTGGSRGGRNKVTIEAILYCDAEVVINETDRVTDLDGKVYSVVGVKGGIFGSHEVAYLEKIR